MIRQFTYTASPWGKSGSGWMVFQQSRNVSSDETKKLYDLYRYEELQNAAETKLFPVQFAYLPMQTGDGAVLTQTTFTGVRWWGDPRPGDFFAHVLLLDKESVKESAKAGVNPVKLFRSPKLQSAFPENLKQKALRIFNKELPCEPTPGLPELQSLSVFPENQQLTFETALKAIPERAAKQLGALVCAIMLRTTGKLDNPIVFDSGNKYSPLIMSLALDLIPPTWRAQTWFAVHFAEHALRRIPVFSSLTFYGTDTKQKADPDSGIVSGVDFKQDPFQFASRDDVQSFKEQLDLLGADVLPEKYEELVSFSKVSLGKTLELNALRSAASFASKIPEMMAKLELGITRAFPGANYNELPLENQKASLVAWFELNMARFKDNAIGFCHECSQNLEKLSMAFQTLKDDNARLNFLNAVSQEAEKSDVASFANMIIDAPNLLGDITEKLPEDSLLRLILEYRNIKDNLAKGCPNAYLNRDSEIVGKLYDKTGPEVKGLSDTKRILEYHQDIAKIHKIEDIKQILSKYTMSGGFPQGINVQKDILSIIRPKEVRDVVSCGFSLEALGLHGVDLICRKWNEERESNENARKLDKQKIRKLHIWVLLIGIILGFIGGWMTGGILSDEKHSLPFVRHEGINEDTEVVDSNSQQQVKNAVWEQEVLNAPNNTRLPQQETSLEKHRIPFDDGKTNIVSESQKGFRKDDILRDASRQINDKLSTEENAPNGNAQINR